MTDTRNRARHAADEATLDLFEQAPQPAQALKAGTAVATKSERTRARGKPARNDRKAPGKAAGGGRGAGGGNRGGGTAASDDFINMAAFAERSYLTYAMSVVRGRAIPNVEDGQKPVQRRILYAMNELGLTAGVQHSKSARIVGEVLGKFHPHGDASTYEALVRMAQDFSLRYPLIDGQGNFGTQDGDPAAAYRYTEARLTPLAELLLSEIDQDTVDFIPNYDGRLKEPKLLPARLPMLLLNGASGVGVGMACELPPHNMKEVAEAAVFMVKHPNATPKALMHIIKGPDFPGGGQIISPREEIFEAYKTGRGSLRARARWKVENLARGQWQIVVYELPPTTSVKKVMAEIEALTNPKPKDKGGKVSAAQSEPEAGRAEPAREGQRRVGQGEQAAARAGAALLAPGARGVHALHAHAHEPGGELPGEPGRAGAGRPPGAQEHRGAGRRVGAVPHRHRHAALEVPPRRRSRSASTSSKAAIIVLLNIDKVIKVIRNSDDPKPDLMKQFKLTETQAEDILEIRLRQLARLEGIKIETELKELKEERKGLKGLLGSEAEMKTLVVEEIRDDAKTVRRRAPHADRDGRARDVRAPGDRRAADRHRVAQRLGARAPGPRARPLRHHLQVRRRAVRGVRNALGAQRRDHRLHRPRVQRGGAELPGRQGRRPAAHLVHRARARRAARARGGRAAGQALSRRDLRRLRLHREVGGPADARQSRQDLHDTRGRRRSDPPGAGAREARAGGRRCPRTAACCSSRRTS